MRRKGREIVGEEMEMLLQKGEYGILSTVGPDGKPYAVPLSYAWKDGLIHLHCAANGNGGDKAIGEETCNHNCSLKETCKFAKIPINHFL